MYAGGLMSPNAEMLQRSGLSTIGDILRHRRLSLFSHVARLEPGVPAHMGAGTGGAGWASAHPEKNQGGHGPPWKF